MNQQNNTQQRQFDSCSDHIVRATACGNAMRAFACRTSDTCREAVRLHDLSPVAAAAIGRLMSGVLMLGCDLDQPGDTITALVQGDGPLQNITVVGEENATVRGTVRQPHVETRYLKSGKLDIGSALGKGTLTIIKDMRLKEPYIGRVALVSGEIAEDIAAYLSISEQIPSIVSLGVKMDRGGITHAGGLMVQLLPNAGEDIVSWLEERVCHLPDVTAMIEDGATPAAMLARLLGEENMTIHEQVPCSYACPCNRERMVKNLLAMGRKELGELAQDPHGISLECHFCDRHYHFSQTEIRQLLGDNPQVE